MIRIDTFPTNRIGDLTYRAGQVFPFGASLVERGGVNFSVYSKDATGCTLVLYHHSQPEPFAEIRFPESFRIGNVYTMLVYGLNIETVEYGYRFEGPWNPAEGYRFGDVLKLVSSRGQLVSAVRRRDIALATY